MHMYIACGLLQESIIGRREGCLRSIEQEAQQCEAGHVDRREKPSEAASG